MGRRAERETVKQLLAQAHAGHSSVLVVRGEAGIGKTALIEHAHHTAAPMGFRVESSIGVESETQFAFAGLHQLCGALLDRLGALPDPQQAALGVAFGQRAGATPDRFLVALAVLNLLAEVAEETPLLCLVDDAQWLDQATAQVLAFVARRVAAERVALVFALRDHGEGDVRPFSGLPQLRLDGLGETDARALLAAAVPTPLDDGVRDRIIAEARGNPLALLELPHNTQPTQLAGGFELPDTLSVPHRIEDAFQHRSGSLPAETQLLLLVAAAEPTGEVALLWRAAEHLGIAREAAAPAEAAGLLEIDTRVRFRHPLARSAVYRAATPPDHRRVHSALAAATDPRTYPDRRAWHRAQSVLGTDEEVAAELERSADRARARGGLAAGAAFLQRSATLTPDRATRARRALEAARAKHDAGASESARELLTAEVGPLDPLQRARLDLLRAQIAFHLTRGTEVPGMLMDAAKALAPLDAALSRETYLHALDAAIINGGGDAVRVAEAALAAPAPGVPTRPVDLLLDGLATTLTRGYAAGAPGLRRALEAFRDSPHTRSVQNSQSDSWLWLAGRNAVAVLDDDLLYVLASRNVQLAREAGALATLPAALSFLSITSVLMGDLARAGELATEATAITQATGGVPLHHAHVILSASRGDQAETTALNAIIAQANIYPEEGVEVSLAQYAVAILHNGLGNYAAAQDAAARACRSDELSISSAGLPELIEASVRAGEPERAAAALERFSSRAGACATSWALGLQARSRALTSTGPAAEKHYREAIEQLRNCRIITHLARTHLVYGEWLRREGRRQDAREQLRTAHQLLSDMGAEAFAERAARELRATGEHPRKRTTQPTDALTAHELHIARLVATGATSREVGAQLFLSPRTIEAHLRNIFRKLGITSRQQLRKMQLP
ncbi:helix-turn-helix domain-containing protein [Phytoactinopolyspora alkaliphila]|uniref:Helix-turn-helix domain-containing protein n=1 Tax=Phytoactinopolyspora alkaliphila TaxID=1783498 RepID=A0A6N9YQ53_9ACTN|nr:LuxR family transcriptional regulator [Phytoactinopolyspora alkaliphila]NED97077.1 helix-turn-helix domain-containing protein [Phytoactinopolyspora alkaliphila]